MKKEYCQTSSSGGIHFSRGGNAPLRGAVKYPGSCHSPLHIRNNKKVKNEYRPRTKKSERFKE